LIAIMALADIVARNIQLVRRQQKLSQQALAKKARISVSYVSMLERGMRVPPLDTLEVIAKALGVAPLYLCQELSAPKSARGAR
jgi:transcriptional regulator with XRE-family HTH domain